MGKLQRTSQSQRFPLSHNPVHFCARQEPETKTWKNCYIASYFLYLPSLSPQLTSRSTAREDPRTTRPKTYVSSAHTATILAPLNSKQTLPLPSRSQDPTPSGTVFFHANRDEGKSDVSRHWAASHLFYSVQFYFTSRWPGQQHHRCSVTPPAR